MKMYKKIFFLAMMLFVPQLLDAQAIDSVRRIINEMGYNMPRLSPLPVTSKKEALISLNGTWQFRPDAGTAWKNIEVPGEWVMQGFTVKPGMYAAYKREFRIPADWKGQRIKLRCDAVYSECEIFINGRKAGDHLGGFTPFETDITSFAEAGKTNSITVNVRCESIADSLASGSKYAVHPLGGITRKIYLFCLPDINCSMIHVSTDFDKSFKNAVLKADVELANETDKDRQVTLTFELTRDGDGQVIIRQNEKPDVAVKADSVLFNQFAIDVKEPSKWDPEHPNMYNLKMYVLSEGKTLEVIQRSFGFKKTEVIKNRVFVNNMPVKLRGVCRHEVMPLRGRSLSQGQWEEDVKIFREGNVNYIRTSHYPPAPEFVEACDRLGMFVEVEAPFCWAHETKVPENKKFKALIQPELEMVNAFRSNPSVLMWSLGNESDIYRDYFAKSAELIRAIDPGRPRNFSDGAPDGDENELEIGNQHYPGPEGPAKFQRYKRPIVFDEYCHLNAYNRFELVTDPGLRDAWGLGFSLMWEKMYHSEGVLGGALWAGIDDSFFLPDGKAVGYGTWGPIDGWRRPKPEYWHMKKVYSPVRIRQQANFDAAAGEISLEIENRMHFSDLSECKFTWKAGNESGSFSASGKPGETISIPVKVPSAEKLYVEVADPRGVIIDQYEFLLTPMISRRNEPESSKIIKTVTDGETLFTSGTVTMVIDNQTGILREIRNNGKKIITADAKFMIIPLNGEGNGVQMTGSNTDIAAFNPVCTNRIVQSTDITVDDDKLIYRVYDSSEEVGGYTEYDLKSGLLTIDYRYVIRKDINPRQYGLVFDLPGSFRKIEWERSGLWNYYPSDMIGRLKGEAFASNDNPLSGPAGPSAKPSQSWSQDQNAYGTNDFRSTKMNIKRYSVSGEDGILTVLSDGSHSARCWIDGKKTSLLVASFSNMGAERFFRSHAILMDKPFKPFQEITGSVTVSFGQNR